MDAGCPGYFGSERAAEHQRAPGSLAWRPGLARRHTPTGSDRSVRLAAVLRGVTTGALDPGWPWSDSDPSPEPHLSVPCRSSALAQTLLRQLTRLTGWAAGLPCWPGCVRGVLDEAPPVVSKGGADERCAQLTGRMLENRNSVSWTGAGARMTRGAGGHFATEPQTCSGIPPSA